MKQDWLVRVTYVDGSVSGYFVYSAWSAKRILAQWLRRRPQARLIDVIQVRTGHSLLWVATQESESGS